MESLQASHENRKIIRPPDSILPEEEISEDGKAVTEAEYWEKYYNHPVFSYEWNNGYLEEKPVTDYAGFLMYWWFAEYTGKSFRRMGISSVPACFPAFSSG